MATTHIKRSTGASRLVNYAEKRAVLKDGINIDVDYAKTQLKQVREIYGNSGSTEAYASRIAFSPNELDPKILTINARHLRLPGIFTKNVP